jgi:hypothetical protein
MITGQVIVSAGLALEATPSEEMLVFSVEPGSGADLTGQVPRPAPGSRLSGFGFEFRALGSEFRLPRPVFGFRVSGSEIQVSGSGFRVPSSGLQVPGSGFGGLIPVRCVRARAFI